MVKRVEVELNESLEKKFQVVKKNMGVQDDCNVFKVLLFDAYLKIINRERP